jgi:membrane associated rhomboid family serine protease
MTVSLIALNVAAFVFELTLGSEVQEFLLLWGIMPVRYTSADVAALFTWPEQILPFLTSMFLHGGWTHLIANMWSLWIFGDNVEDRLGRTRFVALYLLGGIAAALLHIFTNARSPMPTIGASGAIAAVMGRSSLYPRAHVLMLIRHFSLDLSSWFRRCCSWAGGSSCSSSTAR